MKKSLYIILCLTIASMSSCYKDKGNYDYMNLNDVIEIAFGKETYTVISLVDELDITPEITTRNDSEDGFSYIWAIGRPGSGNADTIGTERNLNWKVALDNGLHNLYYTVTNNRTGILYYNTATVNVTTLYSHGFYVLKESGGNSDLDLYIVGDNGETSGTTFTAIHDLFSSLHGAPIPGRPEGFSVIYQYGFLNSDGEYDHTRTVNIVTDEEVRIYDTRDLSLIYDHNSMFFDGTAPEETPWYLCSHGSGLAHISDKGVYTAYQMPPIMPGSGKFSFPNRELGDVRPNPHVCMVSSNEDLVIFDETGGRLLAYDWNWTPHQYVDMDGGGNMMPNLPRDISHDLIFHGTNNIAGSTSGYLVFADKGDPYRRYLYNLEYNGYYNPIKEVRELPQESGMSRADMYAVNEKQARVIYYVLENNLYMYEISSGAETRLSPEGIGASETITYISNKWYDYVAAEAFNYLVIGTSTGSGYKLYLYTMTGPTPNGKPAHIFEGGGTAFSLNYVSESMDNSGVHGHYSYGRY